MSISDELVASIQEATAPDPDVEESPVESETPDEQSPSDGDSAGVEEADSPDGEGTAGTGADEDGSPDGDDAAALQFANQQEAEKAFKELRALQSRQANELGELRQMLQQQAQQQYGPEPEAAPHVDEIEEYAATSPRHAQEAFQWAMENDWSVIPNVIAQISDPVMAEHLRLQYTAQAAEAAAAQRERELAQQLEPVRQSHARQQIENVVNTFEQAFPEASALKDDIAQQVQNDPQIAYMLKSGDPQSVYYGLVQAYNNVRASDSYIQRRIQETLAQRNANRADKTSLDVAGAGPAVPPPSQRTSESETQAAIDAAIADLMK